MIQIIFLLCLEENVCSFEIPEQTSLTEEAGTSQIQNFEIPNNRLSEQPMQKKKYKGDIIYDQGRIEHI